MVETKQSEKRPQEDTAEEEREQPRKNETACLTNVDKKYKLVASQHENENQHSQLLNTNKSAFQVNSVISIATEGWVRQSEKEKSYKTLKEYICDEDQFFHDQESFYKDTSHKIGALVPEYGCVPDQLSGKQGGSLELLFKTVLHAYKGTSVGDYSPPATDQIPPGLLFEIFAAHLHQHLPAAGVKDADKLRILSKLLRQLKCWHFNSGMKERFQTGQLAEQSRNPKKTQPLGSGYGQKNLTEENRNTVQYLPDVKNSSLYESKYTDVVGENNILYPSENILYPSEDNYFILTHVSIPGEGHTSQEMFVIDHDHGQSVVVSSRTADRSQKLEEISHLVSGSKTSKCSRQHDIRMNGSLDTGQSWVDSGGGIPDSDEDQGEGKLKEDLDYFKIHGIDVNLPKGCNLKRKNSFDRLADVRRKYEDQDHPQEGWVNARVDPWLKLGVAHLFCHPGIVSSTKRSQQEQTGADEQDIFSSITEASNPVEENSGENGSEEALSTTSQRQSAEDGEEHEESSTEQAEAKDEQRNVEELSDDASDINPTSANGSKDSDSSREATHVSVSREESGLDPFPTYRPETGSTPVTREMSEGGTTAKQSVIETAVMSRHDLNLETESSRNDTFSSSEHYDSLEEDGCSGARALGHDIDSMPPEPSSPLPFLENTTERILDHETFVSFQAPVQVSSPGNSELICSAYTDPCNAWNEGSVISTLSCDDRGVHNHENYPFGTAQESQSHREIAADRRHTSVVAQEQGGYFHVVTSGEHDFEPGIAEETVYTFTSWHTQEQPTAQREPCPVIHPGFSATREPSFSQSGMQSEMDHISVPGPSSHSIPVQPACLSSAASGSASPPPAPVRLPPITVHSASSLPPYATRTARIDLTRARDRAFAELRKRRATYREDWPTNHSGIDAANMALSGFFVTGQVRMVRCFYCGLELNNLTSAHNIWDEHVRHSPECRYLNLVMGSDFVLKTLRHLRRD